MRAQELSYFHSTFERRPRATPNCRFQPFRSDSCFNRVDHGGCMFMKLLLAAMIATTVAFAQGGGGMGDDMGGTGGRGGGAGGGTGDDTGGVRMQRQSPFDIFADRLK